MKTVRERFAAQGFKLEQMGGHCTAFTRREEDGFHEIITVKGGAVAPTHLTDVCLVGTYLNASEGSEEMGATCAQILDALETTDPAIDQYETLMARLHNTPQPLHHTALTPPLTLDRAAAQRHLSRIYTTFMDTPVAMDEIAEELQQLALAMLGEANVEEFSVAPRVRTLIDRTAWEASETRFAPIYSFLYWKEVAINPELIALGFEDDSHPQDLDPKMARPMAKGGVMQVWFRTDEQTDTEVVGYTVKLLEGDDSLDLYDGDSFDEALAIINETINAGER